MVLPLTMSNPKRPKDTNERAKLIMDIATGEVADNNPDAGKNPHAMALGKLGGKKGGKARAEKLSPERRKEIAKNAAAKRWAKSE
jgi:hypothetical protein